MLASDSPSYRPVGSTVRQMFASIASRYDLANTVLSFGIHHLWKRDLVSRIPKGSNVLDLCTGTGDLLPLIKNRQANVIGADFCAEMLEIAKQRYDMPVQQADALNLPFKDGEFDVVTVAFGVRNLESLTKGLQEMFRVLKTNGKLLVLEFGTPKLPIWKQLFQFYSKVIMPRIGGFLTGNRYAYEYLPETSKNFPCREQFINLLKDCGFTNAEYKTLTGGIAYIYEADRPLR